MAGIAGATNSTIIAPSISPTLPKFRLCQREESITNFRTLVTALKDHLEEEEENNHDPA